MELPPDIIQSIYSFLNQDDKKILENDINNVNKIHWCSSRNLFYYALERNLLDVKMTCAYIAHYGDINLLYECRFVRNFPWDDITALYATNNFKTFEWCYNNGCPISGMILIAAATNADINLLRWWRSKGYAWDTEVVSYICETNNLDVLKWVLQDGGEFWYQQKRGFCIFNYAQFSDLKMLKFCCGEGRDWLNDNLGRRTLNENILIKSIRDENLEMIKWVVGEDRDWMNDGFGKVELTQDAISWILMTKNTDIKNWYLSRTNI